MTFSYSNLPMAGKTTVVLYSAAYLAHHIGDKIKKLKIPVISVVFSLQIYLQVNRSTATYRCIKCVQTFKMFWVY